MKARVRRRLGRVVAMALKEVRHIVRDPQVIAFALGMPVVLIFLFGYAVSFDIDRVPLVVVDQSQSPQSRELVDAFTASDTFRIVAERQDPTASEVLLRNGSAAAILVIPSEFDRHLAAGGDATAQLLLDGADNTSASIALGYANAVSLAASQKRLEAVVGDARPPLEARIRTFFNPRLQSAVFLVPGLMVMVLVMVAVMLTALTVAREYERGTMEQLFATPVGRLEVILGKLGPYFLIGLVQVLLVLVLGVVLFDVPVRGSLLLLMGVASLFLLAMLTQGLLISVVTRSQMVASQIAMISTFLPALLLSGFVFPVENMPWPLQAIATVLPARYFVHAMRAILLRGNGLSIIWGDCLAMALFFAVLLVITVKRFQRTVA